MNTIFVLYFWPISRIVIVPNLWSLLWSCRSTNEILYTLPVDGNLIRRNCCVRLQPLVSQLLLLVLHYYYLCYLFLIYGSPSLLCVRVVSNFTRSTSEKMKWFLKDYIEIRGVRMMFFRCDSKMFGTENSDGPLFIKLRFFEETVSSQYFVTKHFVTT